MNPMDMEFTKWLVTLGVGGVLAGFMFMFYRKDIKQYTDLWKGATDQLIAVIIKNTESNVELITLIKSQKAPVVTRAEVEVIVQETIQNNRVKRVGQ